MNEYKICIVIPLYNQLGYILDTIKLLVEHTKNIIIVDDGSNIECKKELMEVKDKYPDVLIISNEVNEGKGSAVILGIQKAALLGFSHVLQIDADRQHDIDDIPKFIETSLKYPQKIICGVPIYDKNAPKIRMYMRKLTHFWVIINTLSFSIKDSLCGYRVYPVENVLKLLEKSAIALRMGFDIEILVKLYWEGLYIENLKTKVKYNNDNSSKFRPFLDNLEISKVHSKLFFGMLIRLPSLIKRNFFKKITKEQNGQD